MEGMPADLQSKYQKLAAEYSKIRAQASVLKKAVIDEQAKTAELKESVKEKDQSLRKADQEMESLNFRNQQLTKRVTVLQDELDACQNKNKKGKAKSSEGEPTDAHSQVSLDEELEKQISQNARIMFMMQEKEEEYSRQTQQLMERVQNLEREVQQFQRSSTDVEAKYQAKLNDLQSEKLVLSEKVVDKERDVQHYSAQVAALQLQQDRLKADLGHKLQTATDIISTQLPFIDNRHHGLNELNVPPHDRHQQTWSLQLIGQVGSYICDLTSHLSDFHTYTEQRLHAIYYTISPVALRFSSHLKENAKYLRSLEQGYKEFQAKLDSEVLITLETIPSLQFVADKLEKYSYYLEKLQIYQFLILEEENGLPMCNDVMKASNNKLCVYTSAFTSSFVKVNNYVGLLALQSTRTKQHPRNCQKRFIEELVLALSGLHVAAEGLLSVFNEKKNIDQNIPTSSERLHSTNECLVNSLVAMAGTTKELHAVLFDNKKKFLENKTVSGKRTPLKAHPVVADFKSRASSYLRCLEQDEPPSVPYKEALRHREESKGGAVSREALSKQLDGAQQRATELEQDREHWKQEFQLLQMKHTKETQKTRDLEEQLQLSRSSATTPQSEDSAEHRSTGISDHAASPAPSSTNIMADNTAGTPVVNTGLLGQLTSPFQTSAEAEAREEEVKQYFTERINKMVAEKQLSDGKAISLRSECMALHERLQLATEQRAFAEDRLLAAETSLTRVQEELHTTTHNYESQLSMMSEHLANMNEKLTVQKDEIDQLKYQLGQKVPKKGKQK